jgi:wyosine [tRNA(Phe)-imidazoG37] synthetase (radical SAM superfamily)
MRLSMDAMPSFAEIKQFAEKLNSYLNYGFKDEDARSRVVLLAKR